MNESCCGVNGHLLGCINFKKEKLCHNCGCTRANHSTLHTINAIRCPSPQNGWSETYVFKSVEAHPKESSMELKITAEQVKAAAAQCPDAKRVLETLFPKVFSPSSVTVDNGVIRDSCTGTVVAEKRSSGLFQG